MNHLKKEINYYQFNNQYLFVIKQKEKRKKTYEKIGIRLVAMIITVIVIIVYYALKGKDNNIIIIIQQRLIVNVVNQIVGQQIMK